MSEKILIVEDDENLRLALADNLQHEGYEVASAASAGEGAEAVTADSFGLLILDIMLPDKDGYTLCRELRQSGCEAMILMLTARTLEEDIVRGFEAGADDYLAKPYRIAELLARVRALLRRSAPAADASTVVTLSDFSLDLAARKVAGASGEPITLTRTEFDLLAYLLDHRGRALTRQQILDDVWGPDVIVDGRTVDNFVSSLKKKLSWTADSQFRIQTIRGVGYRMEVFGS